MQKVIILKNYISALMKAKQHRRIFQGVIDYVFISYKYSLRAITMWFIVTVSTKIPYTFWIDCLTMYFMILGWCITICNFLLISWGRMGLIVFWITWLLCLGDFLSSLLFVVVVFHHIFFKGKKNYYISNKKTVPRY